MQSPECGRARVIHWVPLERTQSLSCSWAYAKMARWGRRKIRQWTETSTPATDVLGELGQTPSLLRAFVSEPGAH